jgi:hypothetical protein
MSIGTFFEEKKHWKLVSFKVVKINMKGADRTFTCHIVSALLSQPYLILL